MKKYMIGICLVVVGTKLCATTYIKNEDGTVSKTDTLDTSGVQSQIEEAKQRINYRNYQIVILQKQVQDFKDANQVDQDMVTALEAVK